MSMTSSAGKLFLSTPSARRATDTARDKALKQVISIHALREEGDVGEQVFLLMWGISIHALREEGDMANGKNGSHVSDFYPRPPRGGRQLTGLCPFHEDRFLSTPSARRATRRLRQDNQPQVISIHALREEGDRKICVQRVCMDRFLSTPSARRATCHASGKMPLAVISIHALREEGD